MNTNKQAKVCVYLATRAYYDRVLPSLKSLLYYNDIDRIFLLIETNTFPYTLTANVTCINVKEQTFYPKDGPNVNTRWSYMVLLKPILCKILPSDIDTALCMDTDTIVLGDISGIWELPIEHYYFAASLEPAKCHSNYLYTNVGVILLNLRKLRDGKADAIQQSLCTKKYEIVEQDALAEHCQGAILEMPGCYNVCHYTNVEDPPLIRHFAAERNWYDDPLVKAYKGLLFEEIMEKRSSHGRYQKGGETK